MTINQNLTVFAGRAVEDYEPGMRLDPAGHTGYRVRIDWDQYDSGETVDGRLGRLLAEPAAAKLRALVIGAWDFELSRDASSFIELLASARDKLPALEALFIGDITYEEQEISWIRQGDISPLLLAFPQLKVLRVRGSQGLSVGAIRHEQLRELAFESGGLPAAVIERAASAACPSLEHLELWFGSAGYGYTGSLDMLEPLWEASHLPKLRYLGLKNSEEQDEIARRVARAPVLGRLEVLDLSMGTLSDEGAEALLASPHLGSLKKLDVHHHYLSHGMVERLRAAVPELDASDAQGPADDDARYIAVSE